jgi:hypothetical protein
MRLPPELHLAEITTFAAASHHLKEQFAPDYNARFAVHAAEKGSAFLPYAGRPLEDVLCLQEERQIGRDNCVRWARIALQIPPQPHRGHHSKAIVRVHEYPMANSPSLMGRTALGASTATARRSMPHRPLKTARPLVPAGAGTRPVDLWTTQPRCPQPHSPMISKKRTDMCMKRGHLHALPTRLIGRE